MEWFSCRYYNCIIGLTFNIINRIFMNTKLLVKLVSCLAIFVTHIRPLGYLKDFNIKLQYEITYK